MEFPTSVHEETATMAADDVISDLPDDLLLRILSFLPAASEVARTSVLSRRWHHLWPNAIALRFAVVSEPREYSYTQADRDDARRLIAITDAVLASRADGPDIEDLHVSFVYSSEDHNGYIDDPYTGYDFRHYHAADITSGHVASWMGFAARRVVERMKRVLMRKHIMRRKMKEEEEKKVWQPMPEYVYDDEREEERVLLAELPGSMRARVMSLTLGKAILTIPTVGAGSFDALTDVLLSHAKVDAGSDVRLGSLFSSCCCPRLRKLQLRYIEGLTELRLDAVGTLSELRLLDLHGLEALDVAAPGLRFLGINGCFWITSARFSAPRLETLACDHLCPAERLSFNGAASVRCIEDLHLSHVFLRPKNNEWKDEEDENLSAAVWLLRHCTAMDRLQVQIVWPQFGPSQKQQLGEEVDFEDNMMHLPQLSNMRNLKITFNVPWSYGHNVGATITKLIAKCPELEDLSIEICCSKKDCLDQNCICNQPSGWDAWESQKLPLERLRNVDFRNFIPYDSQIQLVSLFLTNAPALERMTLVLHRRTYQNSVPCPQSMSGRG
ncbi:unnamed protein product [Urochloa decumbens]|uniref:F-box domain-containing protein n=1 Tax=Urochloa decumbens TaxID=240449 RepID=A0ABC8WF04_9POAL